MHEISDLAQDENETCDCECGCIHPLAPDEDVVCHECEEGYHATGLGDAPGST